MDNISQQIIQSPFLSTCFDALKEAEKKYLLTPEESDAFIFEMLREFYKEEPVTINEFITNPYYLGSVSEVLFPIWKQELGNMYHSRFDSTYFLVVLNACIGAGKSFVIDIIAKYELHKLLCLKNPALFYGLSPNDVLYFVFYTFKRQIGEDSNWQQFLATLKESKYFKGKVNTPETPYAGKLTNNIACRVASLQNDIVSKAVFFAGMDEFNEKKNSKGSNIGMYRSFLRRMDSRLMDSQGFQPYKLVIASSPKEESDELNSVITEINGTDTKGCYITEGITMMETSGTRLSYSGEMFNVYIDGAKSYLMNDINDVRVTDFNPELVTEVPIEYKKHFQFDVIEAIREVLGQRVGSSGKFFRDSKILDDSNIRENRMPDTIVIPFNIGYEDGVDLLYNQFKRDNIAHPNIPRCIHIDTALNTCRLGLSATFVVPLQVSGFNFEVIKDNTFKNGLFIEDFSTGIETADDQEIPLDVICGFIYKLHITGYRIHLVTYDSYQSASIHQPLERFGITNKYASVDTTKEPYILYKRAMFNQRYIGVKNQIKLDEAKKLMNLEKKVDHPANGTKDIIDGSCGSFNGCLSEIDNLLNDYIKKEQNLGTSLARQLKNAGFKPYKG